MILRLNLCDDSCDDLEVRDLHNMLLNSLESIPFIFCVDCTHN